MTANAGRFVPPAHFGPERELSRWGMATKMLGSQIEGWPKAVFEADVCRLHGPGAALFVMSSEAVKTVLLDNADAYTTGALFRRAMRPAWGKGILLAQGRDWEHQRRAATGAFRPADMAELAPIFARAAERALLRWREGGSPTVDIHAEMTRLTFGILLDSVFSGASDFDRADLARQIGNLFRRINRIPLTWLLFPDRWHETRDDRQLPERKKLIGGIRDLIARRRHSAPLGDLVDLLLQARDPETGIGFDDDLMADNLLGFMVAGHETTTLALTWALYLAAAHPPTMARLRAEVAAVAGNTAIGARHVPGLQFARQVISETMRLYPPGYMLTRVAIQDTVVADAPVRAGERVNLPIYAIHRRAGSFDDPHAFDPDRFGPGVKRPSRFEYLPFGAGPRSCLGASFAMTEAAVVLATLVRDANFTPPPPEQVWPVARLSLVPQGGMPMGVSFRSSAGR